MLVKQANLLLVKGASGQDLIPGEDDLVAGNATY